MARRVVAAVLGMFLCSGLAFGEPLKIGVLTDMSGVIADTVGRGSVVAAELAVSDAGGTVLGRPIEIVSADHQLKPDVGLTIARRWFDEEHVEAIADIPVSTIALGIQNLAHTKGKIALISGAGNPRSLRQVVLADRIRVDVRHQRASARHRSERSRGRREEVVRGRARLFLRTPDGAGSRRRREGDRWTTGRHAARADRDLGLCLASSGRAGSATGRDCLVLCRPRRGSSHRERRSNSACCRREYASRASMLFDPTCTASGLDRMKGIYTTTAFYWDTDDNTRSLRKRFREKMGRPPSALQAGVYSSITHYLKAVKAAGSTSGPEVAKKMHELPISDLTTPSARIRADGRVMRDMLPGPGQIAGGIKSPVGLFQDRPAYESRRVDVGGAQSRLQAGNAVAGRFCRMTTGQLAEQSCASPEALSRPSAEHC